MKPSLIAALAALLLGAAASASAAPPAVKLYTLDCGTISVPDADWFADDGSYKGVSRDLIVPCYLIRHPKGDLLWDAGLPQVIADLPGGKGPEGTTMRRKLTDQLADLGLKPSDIEFLSVSHSHFDHIGNGGLFATATWIVDADEKAHAFRPAARADTQTFGFYSALETAPTRLLEDDATHDVFGDGSVLLVATPGHTPGHRVLMVTLAKAGPVLLTGDMWHLAESREGRKVPRFNVDRAKTLVSMDTVEALAKKTGAKVVRQHVQEDFDAMPKFPAALE
ncbi:MAG TPA: N-acyl homoserine lactonase family protein [Caulobacter sp.]|nr:N-acyl homoserine lactonase family protein [Caulobacter sp.]